MKHAVRAFHTLWLLTWSELPMEDPGDEMHFLKHLSVTFYRNEREKGGNMICFNPSSRLLLTDSSSCMFASATCAWTFLMSSSFWAGDMEDLTPEISTRFIGV